MELKHFTLVTAIVEEGSMTKAADRLYLSQSALSHQLREVETELGVALFHRLNRRLVLTDAGKMVLSSARTIIGEVKRVRDDVKGIALGKAGTLRFAICCYTSYHWLPCLMENFGVAFPGVEIELVGSATNDPLGRLMAGEIDVALVTEKADQAGIDFKVLRNDEMLAVFPVNHPWRKRKYVTAKDFADQHLMVYDQPNHESLFLRKVLIPSGITPRQITRLPLTDAMIQMVMASMGVAVLGKWTLEEYRDSDRLAFAPIGRRGLHRKWYAATVSQIEQPLHVRAFVEYLSAAPAKY